MRLFIIKSVNLILILILMFGYAQYAKDFAKQEAEYESESALAAKAWQELETSGDEEKNPKYEDGTYYGKGVGFGGEILVSVQLKEDKIVEVKIEEADKETPDYLEAAKKVLTFVVNEQSADVDTVSGATLSSNGILDGVREALKQAEAKGGNHDGK